MYQKVIAIVSAIVIFCLFTENKALAQIESINVKTIKIEGNTVFSDSELKSNISRIEGSTVTVDRLTEIRNEIEKYYIEQGYISSGVFIPPQKLEDGNITIQVVEANLSIIEIKGRKRVSEKYIRSRLPTINKPLNVNELAQDLGNLKKDPLIQNIKGELKKIEIGKNLLSIEIIENKPFQTQIQFSDKFSPSVGNLGLELGAKHRNILGFGDTLGIDYTKTEGLDKYGIGYSLPFNTSGGTISFDYNNADSELVEEIVSAFDIQADFESVGFKIRQPIFNNDGEDAAISLEIERLNSETFVLDDVSFPFVEGLEDGKSRITSLRLGQEYANQGEKSLIAAQSQFNLGLDILDATTTEIGTDALFWSWQGNIQWIRLLDRKNTLLRTSLTTQLTPDKLLPLEQVTVGGRNSVRGYRRNLIVGDNGLILLVQGQVPLVTDSSWGNIYLAPFFDFGTVWNNGSDNRNSPSSTLASLGLELDYQLKEFLDAKVFYGFPLIDTDDFGNSSVEERWGFSMSIIPLRF